MDYNTLVTSIYNGIALRLLSGTLEQMEIAQTKYTPEDWAKIIDAMHRINAERQAAE